MAGILKVDQVQSDSNLSFQVAGANVAYMNSTGLQMTGGQIIAGSNTLINSSGLIYANAGIAFPATQVSSADANTLDDYEEGTWTPSLLFGSAAVGQTGTFAGWYTKIGNQVFATCLINLTAKGSSTGAAYISGLPFTSNSNTNYRAMSSTVIWSSFASTYVYVSGLVTTGSTVIEMLGITAAAASQATNITHSDINNGSAMRVSVTYQLS
jgi:hypothetical protein